MKSFKCRAAIMIGCLAAIAGAVGQGQDISELKPLYENHKWIELNDRLRNIKGMPLYRGAIDVTFNQDPRRAEKTLLSVIKSGPRSEYAYEAYEWLSHLYFYRGQYRSLVSIMEQRWAAFPNKKEREREQSTIAGFRGLPNQIVEKIAPSTLHHAEEGIFVPLSIDGSAATYFFDTGAWISCMSESEAARLGLSVKDTSGTLGNSSGSRVGFRTAVAKEVVVGNVRFKNVSFAVFPDNQEPWPNLPLGRRGIIGIPMLVGFGTLHWTRAGTMQIGDRPEPFDIRKSNLVFDNDHLAVTATVAGQRVLATLDTGAETTDLYKPFADEFASLLAEKGKKDSTEERGVGHAEIFDSVTIPKLRIRLDGVDAVLSPAHVLLKPIGANCCIGNFGMDLLKQAPSFGIDFGAMALRLEPVTVPQ
jgi:predicted aspartyl protease